MSHHHVNKTIAREITSMDVEELELKGLLNFLQNERQRMHVAKLRPGDNYRLRVRFREQRFQPKSLPKLHNLQSTVTIFHGVITVSQYR